MVRKSIGQAMVRIPNPSLVITQQPQCKKKANEFFGLSRIPYLDKAREKQRLARMAKEKEAATSQKDARQKKV